MIKPAPPKPRGIAALMLLFCIVALIVGLGFDFLVGAGGRFSPIAQPGGRAALGVGVAAGIVAVAHVMRMLLGRKPREPGEG
jgi:hypothetical protein